VDVLPEARDAGWVGFRRLIAIAAVFTALTAVASGPAGAKAKTPKTVPPASVTTVPPDGTVPDAVAPEAQAQIAWAPATAPVAVAGGSVWAGTTGGVAAIDPTSMRVEATVPTALTAIAIAPSPDGVWVLTSGNGYPRTPDESDLPPYHLIRIDPSTFAVVWEADLGDLRFASSARGNRRVRLAASAGVGWVTGGDVVLRVDVATGSVTPLDLGLSGVAHVAGDAAGLWAIARPGDASSTALVHVDATDGHLDTVLDVGPDVYPWSLATTGDAVWYVVVDPAIATSDRVPYRLTRYDVASGEVSASRAFGIAVVAGDGEVWETVGSPGSGKVGRVDPDTGAVVHVLDLGIPGPGSSDGYVSPPFAVADGYLWSVANGLLLRTTP
jgi:hypothetical protein